MSDINVIILEGNLAADCESREVGGTQKTKATIISNKKYGGKTYTTPMEFQVWGAYATIIATYLRKGTRLTVKGEMRQDTWQGKDGQTHYKLFIHADKISLGPKREKAEITPEGDKSFQDDIPF